VPPFTIAAYARVTWIGVAATPCPNEALARSIFAHGSTLGSRAVPATSPATSIPVFRPMP
jgi:hypothetical protein